jgi:GDP-4-dehydro-6-deoxy-D-mannose reductase
VTAIPLITGATGFAGGHLLRSFVEDGQRILAWANPTGRAPDEHPAVQWRAVDLLDRPSVQAAIREAAPSAIYHCAGIADVHGSWGARARALRINVIGTHHLLEAAREGGLDCRVLVTGSALVYRPSIEPLTEASPIGPATPYGVSKLAQEMAARASPLPVLIARSFNHAGPGQDASYVTSAFARQLADIEAGRADPVLRVGNLEAIRDITDVRDVARAYRLLLHRGVPHEPYNVCSGRGHRIADLLEILLSMTSARIRVERDPDRLRPSDTPVVVGSHDRLTRDTGWYPQIPIERTLADLLEYWRAAAAQPNPHPA